VTIPSIKHKTPSSLDEACALVAQHGQEAALVAGGTDLLGILKGRVRATPPSLLVDIKPIEGLRGVDVGEHGLKIGALTTLADVARHPTIRERYTLLAEAARAVASPQIRNMGTVGGNLCQEPRCWYYRTPENVFHCMRKGGSVCGALLGENRYHSIFGAVRVSPPGCTAHCPAHVNIPSYLGKVREGDLRTAARLVLDSNPMPAITGRVCPHPCQVHCSRVGSDEAVSTRSVERHLGGYTLDHVSDFYAPPPQESGNAIAVVGAGPAGLSAAYYLRRAGHSVTVYDRMPEAGGMLRYCIPAYRLPKDVLHRQVDAFVRMGITFQLGVEIGDSVTLQDLRREHNTVFLATGGWSQKVLSLENAEFLSSGLDFLVDVATGRRESPGTRVVVIGGGSAAVDVAISARRLGVSDVTLVCLEARRDMPAIPEDIEQAVEESIRLLPSWGPKRVLVRSGELAGLELVRCTSVFDRFGSFRPAFDATSTMTVEADCVLVAIGQGPDLRHLKGALNTERGLIIADPETQATTHADVYAGGDATTGSSTVVSAVAAGRRAAGSICRSLSGMPPSDVGNKRGSAAACFHANAEALASSNACRSIARSVPDRRIDTEDTATLDLQAIQAEARRCVDCGCVAVNAADLAPALLALQAILTTTKRTLSVRDFFEAGVASTTSLEPGEILTSVTIPPQPPGCVQSYLKFRIRNSVDFPIVSVATVLSLENDRFTYARMAVGAVAPVPLELHEVEQYLVGRRPDNSTAETAASMAVRGVQPLAANRFKVAIVRALVKKAVLGAASRSGHSKHDLI